jgi:hypothetical protein
MDQPAKPAKEDKTALIFLVSSTIIALCSILTYLCLGINFILAIVFLVVARNDPYSFRFAKANLAVTLALIALTVIFIVVVFSLALGVGYSGIPSSQVGIVMPTTILLSVCSTLLIYGSGTIAYAYLAFKAYKRENCPWF